VRLGFRSLFYQCPSVFISGFIAFRSSSIPPKISNLRSGAHCLARCHPEAIRPGWPKDLSVQLRHQAHLPGRTLSSPGRLFLEAKTRLTNSLDMLKKVI